MIHEESDNVLLALPLNKQFSGRTHYHFPVLQKTLRYTLYLFVVLEEVSSAEKRGKKLIILNKKREKKIFEWFLL